MSDLSTRFLKDVLLYIPHVFLHLYNRIRITGTFPDSWKVATVVPLPKCNNPTDPSELRPVSLLPIIGNILEKLIHLQLSKFLEDTEKLSKFQHGFRKGHSTTSATSKFVDDIASNLDKGYYTMSSLSVVSSFFPTSASSSSSSSPVSD